MSPGGLTRNKISAWLEASIACSGFAVDLLPFVHASGNGDGKARKLFGLDSFSAVELSWLHCAVCLFRGEEPVAPMGLSPAAQRAFEIGMAQARSNLMRMKAILASKDPPVWKDAYPKRDTSLEEANEEKDEDEASSEKEGEGGTGAEEELYRTEANARKILWNMGFRLSKKRAQPKVSAAEIADFWWNFGDGKDSGVVAFCGRLSDEWYEKALVDSAVKKTEAYENVVSTYLSLMRKDTITPEEATRRAWKTVGERDIAADFLPFWRSSSMRQAAREGHSVDEWMVERENERVQAARLP